MEVNSIRTYASVLERLSHELGHSNVWQDALAKVGKGLFGPVSSSPDAR